MIVLFFYKVNIFMKSFIEYIYEATKINQHILDDVFQKLINNGYNLKEEKPSKTLTVLVPKNNRIQTLKNIAIDLNGEYNKHSSKSSAGETIINGIKIIAKPIENKGQSAGEAAEPIVAYMFNVLNGNKQVIKETDSSITTDILNKLRSEEYSEEWIISSKKSAEKLHSVIKDSINYYACHVNGRDISIIPDSSKIITQIFKSKDLAGIILKKDKKAFDDLYVGQKDTWNKADIILVHKKFNISQLDADSLITGADLNAKLNELIQNNIIYPISLKAISKNAELEQIQFIKEGNISDAEAHENELDKISDVKIEFSKTIEIDQKYSGTCYLKSDVFKIQFRNNSASGSKDVLSVELLLKGARGGKAASVLRQKLGLVKGFYKTVSFKDTNDFIQKISDVFGKLNNEQLQDIYSLEKQDSKFYLRTCFKGILALAIAYRNNIQHKMSGTVDLINMFKTFYNAGSGNSSNSIFYLLSMKNDRKK